MRRLWIWIAASAATINVGLWFWAWLGCGLIDWPSDELAARCDAGYYKVYAAGAAAVALGAFLRGLLHHWAPMAIGAAVALVAIPLAEVWPSDPKPDRPPGLTAAQRSERLRLATERCRTADDPDLCESAALIRTCGRETGDFTSCDTHDDVRLPKGYFVQAAWEDRFIVCSRSAGQRPCITESHPISDWPDDDAGPRSPSPPPEPVAAPAPPPPPVTPTPAGPAPDHDFVHQSRSSA